MVENNLLKHKCECGCGKEIKGHAKSSNNWDCTCKACNIGKWKFDLFKEQYPDKKINLIGEKEYVGLVNEYKDRVLNLEGKYVD